MEEKLEESERKFLLDRIEKLEYINKKIFRGWKHTLKNWGYYMKIDLILFLLALILGISLGIILPL